MVNNVTKPLVVVELVHLVLFFHMLSSRRRVKLSFGTTLLKSAMGQKYYLSFICRNEVHKRLLKLGNTFQKYSQKSFLEEVILWFGLDALSEGQPNTSRSTY